MTEDARTVAEATALASVEDLAERALLVVYDQDEPGGRTRLLAVTDGADITFGRSRASTVFIDSERVSRTHAHVTRAGGDIVIEDMGSRNGTRVNGRKIERPTRLSSGDEISVGPITAVLTVTTPVVRRPMVATTAELEARLAAEADRGLRYHRSFALVMMQLKGSLAAIDEALDRMSAHVRPMDTLAEYSADELAVLLPEAEKAAAVDMARTLAQAARGGLGQAPLAVRTGLAVFPNHGSQAGKILSRAQAALRQAQADRRDDVVVAEDHEPVASGDDIIVVAPEMQRVYALVRKVADTSMTVLIIGETGVGKEVVAEQLHRASARRQKNFVRLNCAAIPETLLESELFGHERGAFTGADRRRQGYFEAAHGGTIFLDEIGEITPGLQAKLLRVLEERRFTRVGDTREIEVDARVVCATNRDLEEQVQKGRFREDLFFRISAFTVMVPPLRDRRAEIVPLSEHFVRQAAREMGMAAPPLSDATRAALVAYHWPGNVRELRNAIERAVVLQESGVIEVEHLPDSVRDTAISVPRGDAGEDDAGADVREHIAEVERAAILAAMDSCGGNQTHAARKLGLSRRSLIYKLEKYGLKKKPASQRDE